MMHSYKNASFHILKKENASFRIISAKDVKRGSDVSFRRQKHKMTKWVRNGR